MPQESQDDKDLDYSRFNTKQPVSTPAKPEVEQKATAAMQSETAPEGGQRFSLVRYVKNAYKELRKVTWPTRQEATRSTGIVILFSLMAAGFLGALDYAFTMGLNYILSIQS